MIHEFIDDICDILNIPVPSVSYDISHFQTDTMMAQVDLSGDTIHLKKYDKPNPDQLFAIAHELRHIWQLQYYHDFFFSSYKTADEIDTENYNLQLAEVDANAFATIVMVDCFHLQPLYNGLSKTVVSAIKKRTEEIISDKV